MNDDQILFERVGDWGIITLNRPKVLNALTIEMVSKFREKLIEWRDDSNVRGVLTKGAGDRAFCAGGDIRFVWEVGRDRKDEAVTFFREEYRNNSTIYNFPKPYVALIDGVVMGGGVGVSVHGDFRVAGSKTLFAMPETGIGLFPDVGGGHFMPRLKDGVGLYYALTGARANAADCLAAGIATHYVPPENYAALEDSLCKSALGDKPFDVINAVLSEHSSDPGPAAIDEMRPTISAHFQNPNDFSQLIENLENDSSESANSILQMLLKQSPTSLKVTFQQMLRGQALDFDDVMKMEFRMVHHILDGHDFYEGVRAQLIDKDRNPQWSPSSLSDVDDQAIEGHFENLGSEELKLP
ncbi:MAG: enoyl-CoA hydratase/isomerase family protein [Pseudomonadota bacterium]